MPNPSLSIRSRLLVGFSLILLLMVIVTTVAIRKVGFIESTLTEVTEINSVKQRHAINFRGSAPSVPCCS